MAMPLTTENIIRALTMASLAGLLLAVGLRLTARQVIQALKECRFPLILIANFVAVPAIAVTLIRAFGIGSELSIGMILLAASPFAPVVPVFARLARADLALAAGLTAFFPLLSAFLTLFVCEGALRIVSQSAEIRFDMINILITLVATITIPLGLGVVIRHGAPHLAQAALRKVEATSEAVGALSLTVVTVIEFQSVLQTDWLALLAMLLIFELALGLGCLLGGPDRGKRHVVALGTSNRNIALALLIAIQSFPETRVLSAVVANGLLLILLGLLHVAFWRFTATQEPTIQSDCGQAR
jgi:BASS family bile acid:Na+ symporter